MAKAEKPGQVNNDRLQIAREAQWQSEKELRARLSTALAARATIDEEINGLRNVLQGHQLAVQPVQAQLQEK